MRSLSGVGLALSLVFGCLFLALLAELYYLLWWNKRITNREIEDDYSSPTREFFYMFCWKRPTSLSSTALNPQELSSRVHETNKDFWPKALGEDDELRLQNLSGPPRFLFTIKEETKEDLESEDLEKSRSRRSLNDLLLTIETPFLTPLASHNTSLLPLLLMRSSPPPKFKFLKDAEEKLQRKLKEEAENRAHKIDGSVEEGNEAASPSVTLSDDAKGSFISIIVAKNK
ncbi:unnamed protein product [Thlaspi arvense]|uniref:Uncharacterized protein n=1 Tax=Thlaspi arvense TaxID=13288 RepID=A0AAU9SD45_THLAR|nr:unnamed protein product [Thlaspi arvense]